MGGRAGYVATFIREEEFEAWFIKASGNLSRCERVYYQLEPPDDEIDYSEDGNECLLGEDSDEGL